MASQKITVNDNLQVGYTYELVAPIGKQFSSEFRPNLTPAEMLELGVFGAHYFQGYNSEFPVSWFRNAKNSETHDSRLNYFNIDASQSRQVWDAKGWINPVDPRGWFQWYCRYYYGRRLLGEDERQIKRWKAIRRHIGQIRANCRVGDELCRPRQRQALLHWAYDSRKI